MKVTGKANIRNRFDIVCRDIRTGEETKYQAHNIVLDSMWSRLVNFQPFFDYIHFGTGTGTLSPSRTSLFSHLGTKSASSDVVRRALPTSWRRRQIVLNPEEYVGHELTEVGVAYGSSSSNLVTHAFIEDSEGNPISIVKTDTMVVTIYATIFFELGELTSMYGGQWRWVMPLTHNELLKYLMGESYPTQYFWVSSVIGFRTDGTAPGSHGKSSGILPTEWTKDAANKKVTTPVRRLGITVGNGPIRGFGLGRSDLSGTFRGQFPIAGVFAGTTIEGEIVGVGDGETTGFDLAWEDAENITVYIDGVAVEQGGYAVAARRNIFLGAPVVDLVGDEDYSVLTDGVIGSGGIRTTDVDIDVGIDVGEDYGAREVNSLRAYHGYGVGAGTTITLYGSTNPDFSGGVQLASGVFSHSSWSTITFPAAAYRYYRLVRASSSSDTREVELLSAARHITFATPPAAGAVITADYTVPYIPKDENHVLDLQCSIQWGEG